MPQILVVIILLILLSLLVWFMRWNYNRQGYSYAYDLEWSDVDEEDVAPYVAPQYIPDRDVIQVRSIPVSRRQHTIIAGQTGDGKSQAMISLMVADIKRGYRVYWLNPHLTLFNEEDQQTDLRPIAGKFAQIYEPRAIEQVLDWAVEQIEERKPRYRRNDNDYPTIILYIDEWEGLLDAMTSGLVSLKRILNEGRKFKVFVVMANQSALVQAMGLSSGGREQFITRIVGAVDQTTWRALIGSGIPRQVPRRYSWFLRTRDGVVLIDIPQATRDEVLAILYDASIPDFQEFPARSAMEIDFRAVEPAETSLRKSEIIKEIQEKLRAGNRGKTEIITSLPGYTGRKYSEYARIYEEVLTQHGE